MIRFRLQPHLRLVCIAQVGGRHMEYDCSTSCQALRCGLLTDDCGEMLIQEIFVLGLTERGILIGNSEGFGNTARSKPISDECTLT